MQKFGVESKIIYRGKVAGEIQGKRRISISGLIAKDTYGRILPSANDRVKVAY